MSKRKQRLDELLTAILDSKDDAAMTLQHEFLVEHEVTLDEAYDLIEYMKANLGLGHAFLGPVGQTRT